MKHKNITRSNLECSVLSLGGQNFGSTISREESFRLMDAYFDRGGNVIDTASVYANWRDVEPNISEKTIGIWMKEKNNRNQLIVTTKGAHPNFETMTQQRLAYDEIEFDLDKSLLNLQVDTIDLYWLHRDDPKRSVGEILESLNILKKAGKIRYFGCSNWTTERIEEAQIYAEKHRIQGFSGNQAMWSLAEADLTKTTDSTLVTMDEKMKDYHTSTGLSMFPYSSQAKGLFTKWESGIYTMNDERIDAKYRSSKNIDRYKRAIRLSEELSLSVTQIALGYLLSQPFNTFPILGSRSLEQLDESCEASKVVLTQGQLNYLESGGLNRPIA